MHITHVISSFFPKHSAGTEIYVLNLCHELKKNGHELSVITSTFDEPTVYQFEGIMVYTFKVLSFAEPLEMNGLKQPFGLDEFAVLLKKIKPDIVHFHTFNRAVNSWHLEKAHEMGFKTVFTSHLAGLICSRGDFQFKNRETCKGVLSEWKCMTCLISQKQIGSPMAEMLSVASAVACRMPVLKNKLPALSLIRFKKKELALLREKADAVVALSDWFGKIYDLNGLKNYRLIEQGLSNHLFSTTQTKKESNLIRFSYVGRLYSLKGIDLLIDAFQQLKASNWILNLVVLTERDAYYETIKLKTKNENRIVWHENLKQDAVNQILNETDVLCLPTLIREMAPLSILEAFAKRIPVLGARHGGISDMIRHGENGLLFDNNSIASLVNQLEVLTKNDGLIEKLSSNIQAARSFAQVASEHIELYKEILKLK